MDSERVVDPRTVTFLAWESGILRSDMNSDERDQVLKEFSDDFGKVADCEDPSRVENKEYYPGWVVAEWG